MNMQTRQRVCVVGAGAIGCTLAVRLAMAGQHVSVLARGPTLAAMRQQGLTLTDLEGTHTAQVNASDDPAVFGIQDVVFVCTKADALADVLPAMAPLIGPDTLVIPAVNGVPWWYFKQFPGRFADQRIAAVDPEGTLERALDIRHVIGCVVYITAQVEAPGVVRANNPHLMVFGELKDEMTARLRVLCSLMGKAGIEARATDRIRDTVWTKIIANLTSNPLSVVTGATLRQIYASEELTPSVLSVLHEALLVAASYGARVAFDPTTFLKMGASMGDVRTSMLQDFDAGRPLELAAIGDAVIELGELQGVAMPNTRTILNLARFRSARNLLTVRN
jgi:2-dehydropantoate 2-reductase